MSVAWLTVVALAAGTFAIKATGPVLLGDRTLPAPVAAVVGLLAPSLIAALVVVESFTDRDRLVVDARLAGLAAAAVAIALRRSMMVAVLVAAAATALARALT
jgi:branched-subunit amino acid transport protein